MIPLCEIFRAEYGSNLELNKQIIVPDNDPEGVAFVSRTAKNNGVSARVKPVPGLNPSPAGTLSVALGGSVLATFLQPYPYYSGYHIYRLTALKPFTDKEKLYYCMCIKANAFRYSYGRQANKTLRDILLPAPEDVPSWVASCKFPNLNNIKRAANPNSTVKLPPTHKWMTVKIGDWFEVTGSKTTPLKELQKIGAGKYPYVTTQTENNGVEGHYNFFTEQGGVIAVDSAAAGFASWQPNNFSASDHVEKLIPRFPMNAYIALFLVTIFNANQFRYSYGRKASQARLRTQQIRLPADRNGKPDFTLMEQYIKSLQFSGMIDK